MTESVESVAGETMDSYLFKEGNDLWFFLIGCLCGGIILCFSHSQLK